MAKDGLKEKKIRRRLDHLADFQDGEPFAMIPQKLLRLWIDRRFPDSKFRLLCCFLTNAEYFHCKRVFLENRFDAGTLKKYLPDLIAEGFLEVEERKREKGGTEKIYHVNSLHEWVLPSQVADPGHAGDRQIEPETTQPSQVADPGHAGDRDAGDRDAGGLNNTKANQTNFKDSHTQQSEVAKNPYDNKAEEFADRLMADYVIGCDPKLLSKTLGLCAQNLRRDLSWIEERYDEWSLYLAARRPHLTDPSHAIFNWVKGYREPQRKGATRERKPEPVYTETTLEDIERQLNGGAKP